VKNFRVENENECLREGAAAEPVSPAGEPRPGFVPIKTDDQLDLQSLHRVRERWVVRRTSVIFGRGFSAAMVSAE
jgi:transposase